MLQIKGYASIYYGYWYLFLIKMHGVSRSYKLNVFFFFELSDKTSKSTPNGTPFSLTALNCLALRPGI